MPSPPFAERRWWLGEAGHGYLLDGVVGEAAAVPRLAHRLGVAVGVGGTGGEQVGAGSRGPGVGPAAPGPLVPGRVEFGRCPGRPAVDADLYPLDRGTARPGPALDG